LTLNTFVHNIISQYRIVTDALPLPVMLHMCTVYYSLLRISEEVC